MYAPNTTQFHASPPGYSFERPKEVVAGRLVLNLQVTTYPTALRRALALERYRLKATIWMVRRYFRVGSWHYVEFGVLYQPRKSFPEDKPAQLEEPAGMCMTQPLAQVAAVS